MVMEFKAQGQFRNADMILKKASNVAIKQILSHYGTIGVSALAAQTPIDTGETAESWGFEIENDKNVWRLIFTNSKMAGNTPVAILLQYGHGTGGGGYVEGVDYINPAVKNLFKELAFKAWKEVSAK